MKAIIRAALVVVLALAAAPLFAIDGQQQRPASLVDDVIRMTKAGVDEQAVLAFVEKYDGKFDVTADDLIAMSDAKVSRQVIKAVLDEADERDGTVRERREVVVTPRYYPSYWGPRYYDPFYYYDPFWYGPRFSVGFSFGRYYGGHYYRGGRFGHHRR